MNVRARGLETQRGQSRPSGAQPQTATSNKHFHIMNNEIRLPFSNAKEFVTWAREALARKKAVTDKAQRDWEEYITKHHQTPV